MKIGATGNEGHATSIAVETTGLTNDAAKVEGKGAVKLIEDAGRAAKMANSNPERGRMINIHA